MQLSDKPPPYSPLRQHGVGYPFIISLRPVYLHISQWAEHLLSNAAQWLSLFKTQAL